MRTTLLAAALCAITLAVFAQTLQHDFLDFDDQVYVIENPNLRAGLTPAAIWHAFREPYEANWVPLTWISLQLDYALFGLDPGGYHATNLLLHLGATLLLFFALRRMTGDELPAAWVAGVFAIHPLHVESVAWIAERKDTLSGFGFALGLLAYARYAAAPSLARYAGVLGATLLSLLAKPTAVTLPFVLLLLDFWPLRRIHSGRRVWIEKLPLLLASAAVSWIALRTQAGAGALTVGDALPLPIRSANAALATWAYLVDAFWPRGLAVFYPHPSDDLSIPAAGLAAAGLLAVSLVLLWRRRRQPYLPVGWFWFLGMLVPVSGLVQVGLQERADRYTYLPLIGLGIALAWGARDLARSAAQRRATGALAVVSLIALAFAAHTQTRHWRNTESLFLHAAEVTKDNWLAHQWVGSILLRGNELDAAERRFRAAAQLQPEWTEPQLGLGDVNAARGRWNEAIRAYRKAVNLRPRDAKPRIRLARALSAAGDRERALSNARQAVELAEGSMRADARVVLGSILMLENEYGEALDVFDAAIEIAPELPNAHLFRGCLLYTTWRMPEGDEALHTAQRLGIPRSQIETMLAALEQRVRERGDATLAAAIGERRTRFTGPGGKPDPASPATPPPGSPPDR